MNFSVTGSGSIAPIVFDIHVHHFCKKDVTSTLRHAFGPIASILLMVQKSQGQPPLGCIFQTL